MQARQRVADLLDHPLTDTVLVSEAQHPPGDGLAVDRGAEEEGPAEHRFVATDVVDVRDRDTGVLGERAYGGLAGHVEQLDGGARDHGEREPLRAFVAGRVEQGVQSPRAG